MKFPLSPLILLASLLACSNIQSPVTPAPKDNHFAIRLTYAQDSTNYCWYWVIPSAGEMFCSETLHAADTAGATYFHGDADDEVGFAYDSIYGYTTAPLLWDSVTCGHNGCTRWIYGIQFDRAKYWLGIGLVCYLAGQPVAYIISIRNSDYRIGIPGDTAFVSLRDSIYTAPRTTRNNIFTIWHLGQTMQSFSISAASTPTGFSATIVSALPIAYDNNRAIGQTYFKISSSNAVLPGTYNIEFNITVNGKNFGNVPCTIIITN